MSAVDQPKTKYLNQVRGHLSDALGATPITDVTDRDVNAWIQRMQRNVLAVKMIIDVSGLLSATMMTAVRSGQLTANPNHGIKLPKSAAADDGMRLLTPAEFELLRAATSPT